MTTLVLIPGIRGDPGEYARLVPLLRRDVHVVATPDAGPHLAEIAAAVAATLPNGEWDVVGASFGGLVGWALPPARVRSLTTIGTLPWPTPRARRMALAAALLRRAPERLYRELYAPRARASWEEDGGDPLDTLVIPPGRVFADRLAAIAAWGLPLRPPGRARWIWGATDRFIQWNTGELIAAGLDPIVVPGGHRPHFSHPSEVARWLL